MAFPRRWHLYWDLNDRKGGTSYSEFKGQSILKIGPVAVKAFRRNEVWLKGQKKAEQLKHRGEGGAVGDEVGVSSHMLSKSGCRVGIWFFGQWMGSHWRALSERVTWCTLVWTGSLWLLWEQHIGGDSWSGDQVGALVAVWFSLKYLLQTNNKSKAPLVFKQNIKILIII